MTDTQPAVNDRDATVEVEQLDFTGVPVLRIRPARARAHTALLHFHGGGYRQGSPQIFSDSVARIAVACRTQVFSVGYRLSPQSAFPAAVDDAVTAYVSITEQIAPNRLVLWGDSAGGGLAAALMLRLRQLQIPAPSGAFLFSPWADLRNTAGSFAENAMTDERFSLDKATEAAASYLAGHPATDPLASPVLGDWAGQPRIVLQASDSEVLRDDSLLLARIATDAGVDVRLKLHNGVPHIWNLAYPSTPASEQAIDYMVEQLGEMLDPIVRA
ncbi:alpha/beta hydrolase [Nocardia sp. 348MFTsu5.1]|uniref:alpha/beta hydrolase n=1 Tax=Nocardia sp. 348MFTsu5.1 TaxID=1172185 RepID=UPI00035C6FA9|nr:alpha/beta hydrolase [Nocardia sp. 348MFTsu5.1]